MTINDGKGIFDKYGMLEEIKKRLEILADAKGVFRCGLIWDISDMVKAVEEGLRKDDTHGTKKRRRERHSASAGVVQLVPRTHSILSAGFFTINL